MFVILVLLLSISNGFGKVHKVAPYPEHQPPQWQEIVAFVNQKIGHLERSLNIKDRDIHQLESRIEHQHIEIMQLKQDVKSLKQGIRRPVVNGQAKQGLDSNTDAFNNFKEIDSSNHVLASSKTAKWTEFNKNSSINSSTKRPGATTTKKELSSTTSVGVDDISNTPVDPPGSIPSRDDYGLHLAASVDVTGEFPRQYADSKDANMYTRHETKQKRVVSEQPIAFHAYLSNSVDARVHATVIFDNEQLDQGAGYNPLDGIYSVPEKGTYIITWTLVADRHASFKTELIVNGVALGNSWTDADEINDLHQTSATTILTLSQGDHVFVRVGNNARGKISTELSNPTFSGWKIN